MYVHFTPINLFYYIFTQSSPTSLGNMPLTIDLKLLMIVCFHTEYRSTPDRKNLHITIIIPYSINISQSLLLSAIRTILR